MGNFLDISRFMKGPGEKPFWDPHPACTHVHVVMGDSFGGSLKRVLKELGWAQHHKIITINDNYAIGPIGNLDSPEGRRMRSEWFRSHIADTIFEDDDERQEEYTAILNKLKQIPERAEIVVWASRSVQEQAGLRLAIHLLRRVPNPIRVFDPCEAREAPHRRPEAPWNIVVPAKFRLTSLSHCLENWTKLQS